MPHPIRLLVTLSLLLASCQTPSTTAKITTFYSHPGAETLYRTGNYAGAQAMCNQAIQLILNAQGPKSPQLADPLVDLASVQLRLAQYPEAKKSLDHADQVINRADPAQAHLIARLDNNKGWRLYALGETESAQAVFENARSNLQKTDPNDSLEMAEILNNLGLMHQEAAQDLTRLNEARRLLDQSAQMRRRLTGDNSPETAESQANISALLLDVARAQLEAARTTADARTAITNIHTAVTAMEKAVDLSVKVYSEGNPETAPPRTSLAIGYALTNELDRAETQAQRALAITTSALGPDHPERATELSTLALIYIRQTHYDRAEKALIEALAIDEKVYGPTSSRVLHDLTALQRLYESSGNVSKLRDVKSRIEKISNKDI